MRSDPILLPSSAPRTRRAIGFSHKLGGVDQVEDLGLCTYADPTRFFSYRRTTHRAETDYGRHVNAIALAGD